MGILEFYNSIQKHKSISSAITPNFLKKMDIHHFLLDFNSIIYGSMHSIVSEVNSFMQNVLKYLYQKKSINNKLFDELFSKYDMKDIQSKILLDSEPMDVIHLFHNHFNDHRLDKMIIVSVINTVFHLIRTYCHNDSIKTLMLALDGVPSKGKMIEQKQRRYLTAITDEYKKKILHKYKDYLSEQDNYVYLAKKHPITWVTKMTPGTLFMDKLSKYLKSDSIQKKFKINRSQMEIVISDIYEVGEGEKKIMNYINTYLLKTTDNIVVYSPDADVILLCILLPMKNVFTLRHNQQEMCYDIIDTKMLKENIAYYINNNPKLPKEQFDVARINYDIVCVSTLFGNDFVPKIPSLNVAQGFQSIMDSYFKILLQYKNKSTYLVSQSKDGLFHMNFSFLKDILRDLIPIETDFIKNNDMYNTYITARQTKEVFSYVEITKENIVSIVNEFKHNYFELQNLIKNGGRVSFYEHNDDFMESLRKSVVIVYRGQAVNTTNLTNNEMIELLRTHYQKFHDFPRLNINLNTYSNSINDQRHKKRIKDAGINNDDYLKELYRFDNMLDEYQKKFHAYKIDLSKNKVNAYYSTYFGVKLFENGNKLSKDASQVMRDYLEGIMWVFQSYYNDRSYINTWSYPHEKGPLLQHLVMYLDSIKQSEFDNLYQNLDRYHVKKLSTYFTPIEQLIYVSPMVDNILNLLPKNYREYIKSDKLDPFLKKYFIDIKKLADNLWKEPVSSDLDCRGIPYLNKCIVNSIHRTSESDDKLFLKAIRNVVPTQESTRRSKNIEPDY